MNKKAFTLIELLVVVLIIGILAAIALPQYEKAVEKSRAAEALQTLKYLKQMGDVYLLEHPGAQFVSFEDMGVNFSNDFTIYHVDGYYDFACNKYWCFGSNGMDYGYDGWAYPDAPVACRGTYDGSDADFLYCLGYLSVAEGLSGEIICNNDTKNYCSLFGTTNNQPIKM